MELHLGEDPREQCLAPDLCHSLWSVELSQVTRHRSEELRAQAGKRLEDESQRLSLPRGRPPHWSAFEPEGGWDDKRGEEEASRLKVIASACV